MNSCEQSWGWFTLLRLALVQAALGAVAVLVTSTLNRVMIIELSLPALLPAALVAVHYLVQLLRPRIGYGADRGGRSTPWIIGGMAVLALGGVLAAVATAWMMTSTVAGCALALLAYAAVGLGIGAAGTSNLVLLTRVVAPTRRAAAATLMWCMMIAGFAVSASVAGHYLQPFTPGRLVLVFSVAALGALLLAVLAVWNVEPRGPQRRQRPEAANGPARNGFATALRQLWDEPAARSFTVFLFVSMLAYSAQELLVESFAGRVFGFAPGASAQLAGLQHAGVLAGMLAVAISSAWLGARATRGWMVAGTLGSAAAIAALAGLSLLRLSSPLPAMVFTVGLANGTFAVAALAMMMELGAAGGRSNEGLRLGLWGAAQAVAFAIGGLASGVAVDVSRRIWPNSGTAYAAVLLLGAALFLLATHFARQAAAASAGPAGVAGTRAALSDTIGLAA